MRQTRVKRGCTSYLAVRQSRAQGYRPINLKPSPNHHDVLHSRILSCYFENSRQVPLVWNVSGFVEQIHVGDFLFDHEAECRSWSVNFRDKHIIDIAGRNNVWPPSPVRHVPTMEIVSSIVIPWEVSIPVTTKITTAELIVVALVMTALIAFAAKVIAAIIMTLRPHSPSVIMWLPSIISVSLPISIFFAVISLTDRSVIC
mmetsp:Transcript_12494/g.24173  ORF Transcript_12494/g.24173 Transcript_12494/m.24173 type:complete len:201 (+) Transcript_12494:374-976(+)